MQCFPRNPYSLKNLPVSKSRKFFVYLIAKTVNILLELPSEIKDNDCNLTENKADKQANFKASQASSKYPDLN